MLDLVKTCKDCLMESSLVRGLLAYFNLSHMYQEVPQTDPDELEPIASREAQSNSSQPPNSNESVGKDPNLIWLGNKAAEHDVGSSSDNAENSDDEELAALATVLSSATKSTLGV